MQHHESLQKHYVKYRSQGQKYSIYGIYVSIYVIWNLTADKINIILEIRKWFPVGWGRDWLKSAKQNILKW